jgi:DNA-binding IclR family transcriptional regulator
MVKTVRAYRRSARKQQIIKQLRIWHENGYAKEATSYKLAKALDVRPSQKFRDILNEMVAEGYLECVERDQTGRMTTRFYLLASSQLITEKYSHRHISVKSRGVAVGQLEMFQ